MRAINLKTLGGRMIESAVCSNIAETLNIAFKFLFLVPIDYKTFNQCCSPSFIIKVLSFCRQLHVSFKFFFFILLLFYAKNVLK